MPIRRKITWVSLIVLAIGIKIFSWFPQAVETYYSRGLYPVIARTQRLLFGRLPFSIGDILYLSVIFLLLYRLVRLLRRLLFGQMEKGWGRRLAGRIVFVLLWVYVLFNGLWGLNYDRLGVADQLGLNVRPYTTAELNALTSILLQQLNDLDSLSRPGRDALAGMRNLREGAITAYDSLAAVDPRFAYRNPSVKASLFSYPGVYLGFAGYYNPFSGEAQVNSMNPLFTLPFTVCHEIGHQLGYGKENEANFVGFLAARSSPDPVFRYSVYFDLYLYAVRELYARDSILGRSYRNKMKPGIRRDLRELQRFNRTYANPLEPVIWKVYGRYLRANRQPHGVVTYTEVTAWLIAYAKRYGRNALVQRPARSNPLLPPPGWPF